MDNQFQIRYKKLSTHEPAPYAELCKVILNYDDTKKESSSHYIQTSKDEENPKWITIGEFIESLLKEELIKKEFLEKYLILLQKKDTAQ